jgi:FixJ family two-component response regulator
VLAVDMLTGHATDTAFGRPPVIAHALATWRDRPDAWRAAPRTDVALDAAHPTVFVIDDDPGIREALEGLFRSIGLRAELFASVQAFLDRAHLALVGCLVLDIRLPGRSGLDLQEDLARAGLHLPVIFITGYADIRMSVRAMKAGAVEFLTKPVRQQDLLDAIQVALARDIARWRAGLTATDLRAAFASLTPRERDTMTLIVVGRPNKQIAFEMGISESTVKLHRGRVMGKMRARSVAELVRMVDQLGLGPICTVKAA